MPGRSTVPGRLSWAGRRTLAAAGFSSRALNLPTPPGAPAVWMLDAREAGLDGPGLRDFARSTAQNSGSVWTCRSYRYPYALVTAYDEVLGVDIEHVTSCDAALADLICTPAERGDPACVDDRDNYLCSLWCAKEALAKALGDAMSYVPSRLGSPTRWPVAQTEVSELHDATLAAYGAPRHAGRWRAAPLGTPEGYVGWLCWSVAT